MHRLLSQLKRVIRCSFFCRTTFHRINTEKPDKCAIRPGRQRGAWVIYGVHHLVACPSVSWCTLKGKDAPLCLIRCRVQACLLVFAYASTYLDSPPPCSVLFWLGRPCYRLFRPRVDANALFVISGASSRFMPSVCLFSCCFIKRRDMGGTPSFCCFQRGFPVRMEAAPAPWPPASRQLRRKKGGVVKMTALKAPSSTLCYIWTPGFSFRFLHVPCFAFNFLFLSPRYALACSHGRRVLPLSVCWTQTSFPFPDTRR